MVVLQGDRQLLFDYRIEFEFFKSNKFGIIYMFFYIFERRLKILCINWI